MKKTTNVLHPVHKKTIGNFNNSTLILAHSKNQFRFLMNKNGKSFYVEAS